MENFFSDTQKKTRVDKHHPAIELSRGSQGGVRGLVEWYFNSRNITVDTVDIVATRANNGSLCSDIKNFPGVTTNSLSCITLPLALVRSRII